MAGGLKKRMRQVNAESRLRFGGQKRQLRAALRDADQTYRTDVRVARSTARSTKRTARQAQPVIEKAVGDALATTQRTDVGTLPAGATRDSAATTRRLSEMLAGAKVELEQRRVDADAGKSSAVRAAASTRATTKQGLRSQLKGVSGDAGAFKQQRAGELGTEAADRRIRRRGQDVTAKNNAADNVQSERNSKRSSGVDPDTGKPIPGGKLDPKAKGKKATPARQQAASSALSLARTQAQRLKAAGRGRGEVGPLLVEGRDSQTFDDPDSPGTKIKVPGVKKVDQLWASVALDIEYDGEISKGNLARLRKLGYGANMLGIGKYKPKKQAPKPAPGSTGPLSQRRK